MEKNNGAAARRLQNYKAKAARSVATIRAHHGDRAETVIKNMRADDWRAQRYPVARGGGNWQSLEKVKRADEREYYADSFDSLGWRQLGRADEVSRNEGSRAVDHNGWYCDAYQSETVAGYVLQIPARDGKPQYVPGIAWSDADGVTVWPLDRYDEALDAARAADGYAEHVAEKGREYSEAWQAGQDWADIGEEIATARRDALALLREMRPLRKRGDGSPAICAALRERIESLIDDIATARQKREELVDNNRWHAEAFNDGASAIVIA